jgi:D-amino-acid oxidase
VPQTNPEVLVVGAGVIGLTTAICLAEAGVRTAIAAAEPPERTTSFAAGAVWGPHLVGRDDRVAGWAKVTLDWLTELAGSQAAPHGLGADVVRIMTGMAAGRDPGIGLPEFASAETDLTALTECAPEDVPTGYRVAWRLSAPVVAMPPFLDWLRARYDRAGGESSFPGKFASLREAARYGRGATVVVNCAGSGARDLVPDPEVTAVRGQAVVASNPGLTEFFVGTGPDPADLTYLFPHGDTVLLGGTEERGNWSREPDPQTARRILAACTAVQPALRDARVLGHRVGLRPARPRVRLVAEQADGSTVVHNYGHGGAGVTLSWGCAQDAAALAMAALSG